MREHSLKTLAPYWDAIRDGHKLFEVRRDDRGFRRGDKLLLRRYEGGMYTTRRGTSAQEARALTIGATVGFILPGGQLGIELGYVVMSLHGIDCSKALESQIK